MDKIIKGLDSAKMSLGDLKPLDLAMKQWATYCLTYYNGKLLRGGIEISIAINSFISEVENLD